MSTGFMPYAARDYCAPVYRSPAPHVRASLQGVAMESSERRHGDFMSLSTWSGWTNGPAATGGSVPHERADGGLEGEVFLSGRSIHLGGLIHAETPRGLWQLMERVGSLLTSPRWDWLVVEEQHLGLARQVRVSRMVEPDLTQLTETLATYTLHLESAASARLAVTESTLVLAPGGSGTIGNVGTYPADLTLELVGPLTNPAFTWGARGWAYKGSIAAGTRITVDMTTREVKNPVTGVLMRKAASGEWIKAQPGTRNVTMSGSGAGTATWSWSSAWS